MAAALQVLIVDDDGVLRRALRSAFELKGCLVETARDGKQALDLIDRVSPSLVLLDMHMPVMDGPSFVSELHRRGISLPILLMTSGQNAEEAARALGVAAFLTKPFELVRLMTTVDRLLPRRMVG